MFENVCLWPFFFFECSSDCYLSSTILEIGAVFLSWLFVLYLIYRMSPGPGRQDASSLVSFWTFLAWHDISSSTSPPWGLNRIRVPTHFTDSVTKCCFLHTHTLRIMFDRHHCVSSLCNQTLVRWILITLTSYILIDAGEDITISYILIISFSTLHILSGFNHTDWLL